MGKAELRQEVKQSLSKLSKAETKDGSFTISKSIKLLISELNSKEKINGLVIGGFIPILKEPEWFLDFNLEDDFNYSLVHMHDEVKLSFHKVKLEDIQDYAHGLKLVDGLLANETIPDVLLIPGVAFTKNFERLGRGKGYFDSYLSRFTGVKIGVFFECQLAESVFCEKHDEKLDYIVTEKKIYRRG